MKPDTVSVPREKIARIIDPFPFLFSDEHGKGEAARLQHDALKKADRIIAFLAAAPKVEQGPVAWLRDAHGGQHDECLVPAAQGDPDAFPVYRGAPASDELPPISLDGPHKPDKHRVWLARKLLDSKLTDAEVYGIVAHHPAIPRIAKHKEAQ